MTQLKQEQMRSNMVKYHRGLARERTLQEQTQLRLSSLPSKLNHPSCSFSQSGHPFQMRIVNQGQKLKIYIRLQYTNEYMFDRKSTNIAVSERSLAILAPSVRHFSANEK
jgi:hypothetical protein